METQFSIYYHPKHRPTVEITNETGHYKRFTDVTPSSIFRIGKYYINHGYRTNWFTSDTWGKFSQSIDIDMEHSDNIWTITIFKYERINSFDVNKISVSSLMRIMRIFYSQESHRTIWARE